MFLDFLKSLVIPRYMEKYRFISVIFPILIFGLTVIILITPYRTTLNNNREKMVFDERLQVVGFYELNDPEFDYSVIKDGGYIIETVEENGVQKRVMKTNFTDTSKFELYNLSYLNDAGKTVKVHLLFDIHSIRDDGIKAMSNAYDALYDVSDDTSQEVQNKRAYVSLLTYVEQVKNPELDVNAKIHELQGLTNKALEEKWKVLSYFDYYNIETNVNEDAYLMVFNRDYMQFQTPVYNEDGVKLPINETSLPVAYYEGFEFDINGYQNISELGQKIALTRVDIEILLVEQQYILGAAVVVLLYTLIITLIFWLFFKRRGTLKKFKEYYNIAGIASIIPTIVSFVILWFVPNAITLYGVGFSIYYVFVLYRINKLTPIE